jgi:hypothetical protein
MWHNAASLLVVVVHGLHVLRISYFALARANDLLAATPDTVIGHTGASPGAAPGCAPYPASEIDA